MYVELEMQSVLDTTETKGEKTHMEEPIYSPLLRMIKAKGGPSATVALIARLLSHPEGSAWNEVKAFG